MIQKEEADPEVAEGVETSGRPTNLLEQQIEQDIYQLQLKL